jgi:hypothetical protein
MFSMRGNEFKGFSASQRLRRGGSPSTHAAQGLTNDKGSDSGRLIREFLYRTVKRKHTASVLTSITSSECAEMSIPFL